MCAAIMAIVIALLQNRQLPVLITLLARRGAIDWLLFIVRSEMNGHTWLLLLLV